jgi:UDP-N-acetyl-D-mannosaminuronic acid dehydrogenase
MDVMQYKYPRAQDLPRAGFAAGPCLFKDTSQLSAFNNNMFLLGSAAISVNEGFPYYIVSKLKERYDLKNKTVGILGMAFKNDIDDPRDSLSYTLRNLLKYNSKEVICSDEYIIDKEFVSAQKLIELSDIIILATPHTSYKKLTIPANKVLIDVWNFIK